MGGLRRRRPFIHPGSFRHVEDVDDVATFQNGMTDGADELDPQRGTPGEAGPHGPERSSRVGAGADLDEGNDEVAGDENCVFDEDEAPTPPRDAGGEPDGDGGLSRALPRKVPGAARGAGAAVPGERACDATG